MFWMASNSLARSYFLETDLLTPAEQRVLKAFRQFLMTPGKMLCFHGPTLKQYGPALKTLIRKEMLVEETFKGGYSLTKEGYTAMRSCS